MRYGILGPLEVSEGARTLPVGHGKQRALLALLLLEANRVVSSDRLIDELWGERPPPTAAKALQGHVSTLRKILGASRILTRPPGYQLELDGDELDLHNFEGLLERGMAALADGDASAAARLLGDALALWRGPALADLAFEPFAQPERLRLEELHLVAIEERIDADLALGRRAELAGELEALLAQHPFRERLRGQLMLALYRSGRQAEALEAYRAARTTLSDELGIEPGAQLQELERAILNHDAALDLPARAEAGEPPAPAAIPAEERRLVSILFADLGAGAEIDPELQRDALDQLEATAVEEIEAAGGRVESRVGDSLLASFGAAVAQEDHVERALHGALALRARMDAARIGVESGEVLVTSAAGAGASVSGAPVILAARLARDGAQGEIGVGVRAAAAARGAFELGAKDVGGSWVLLGALAPQRPRGVRGLGRTFVGRESELQLLEASFERVTQTGRPQLSAVLGDAGVGKTSLIAALQERLEPRAARWRTGRCVAYGRGNTYRPLLEILRAELGVRADDAPAEVRRALGDEPMLASALGAGAPPSLHPLEAREQLFDAWVRFGERLCGDGPAVLAVEDLHWADEALLELLARLAREVRGPLLLVATARPELLGGPSPLTAGRGDLARVWLEPLSGPEAALMLSELAGDVPEEVSRWVLERAEGNPFYLEEALQSLLDHGVLRGGRGGWSADRLPAVLAASDSVQSLIAARLDQLPPNAKAAVQAAATVGRSFWERAVRELIDEPQFAFEPFEERDFARRAGHSSLEGEREWLFKHALTRDVAYASLPAARRAALHARFARWLEHSGGGRDEHAPQLAHHYAEALAAGVDEKSRAELEERALHWLSRAADLAYGRFEMQDAAALFERAAELEPEASARVELLQQSAEASYKRFDMGRFRETTERALEACGDGPQAAHLYGRLALEGSKPFLWRDPPSRADVERWIDGALERSEELSRPRAAALIARANLDPAASAAAGAEGTELARRLGETGLESMGYEVAAWGSAKLGRLEEAGQFIDRGLALLPEIGDPDIRGGRMFSAIIAHLRLGRVERARRLAVDHDQLVARLTQHHDVHGVAGLLLMATVEGRWDAAVALLKRAETATRANLDTPCQFNWRSLVCAALACAYLGDEHEAERLEQRAREIAWIGGPLAKEPALLRLALVRGDLGTAESLVAENPGADVFDADYGAARLDALVALGQREAVEAEAADALALGGYVEPFALRALGLVRQDADLLARAAAVFDELGLAWRAAETRALR